MMKKILTILFISLFFFAGSCLQASAEIKQNTVEQYLQQKKREGKKPNHLINQSSPYLLQHAYNPVNWYPWGEEAFARARKEHKPIFLSIGYSTCHWCHVMEHESFENKKIADYLNKHFISIKVDREERPDIDAVYMSATELISGNGGWPMTVFTDDQLRPFYAATYYPPFSTPRSLGLMEVLKKINKLWHDEPKRINTIALTVTSRIKKMAKETGENVTVQPDITVKAMRVIESQFDSEAGGFGVAPKFPRFGIFAFLTRQAKENNLSSPRAESMMTLTLDYMAAGGFYDQVGGGFHRYSVDEYWRVPHFEKMLYTQALMALAYLDFYPLDRKPRYKQVIIETLNFVYREMHAPGGSFYSALDADSVRPGKPGEHAEGAYYLWTQAQLKKVLNKKEFQFIRDYYGIEPDGNIDSDPHNQFGRGNVLAIAEDFRDIKLSAQQQALLHSARTKLKKARLLRPRPHLDDKIITAWNGMMISAYANAAKTFSGERKVFLSRAVNTADFLLKHLLNSHNGELYRSYRNGRVAGVATLNDYAWLIKGFIDIYNVDHDKKWLRWAQQLTRKQDTLFLDRKSGAYYDVAKTDTTVLFRSKTAYDGALPSANAIVMENMVSLSRLSEDKKQQQQYLQRAHKIRHAFASVINQNPAATAMLLSNN